MKIPESGVDSFAMEGINDHPYDIANRIYKDYMGFGVTFGIINQVGTVASPITITLKDAG